MESTLARTYITTKIESPTGTHDVYKESFVAFIDILGFANIIEKSSSDQNLTRGLYKALRDAPTSSPLIGPPNYPPGLTYGDFVSTNFSDSIVISAERSPQGLMTVLEIGRAFASVLLQFGLLTRGGVAGGQLIHDRNAIFGPGLVSSYLIESKEARFARIILSDECSEFVSREIALQSDISAYFVDTLKTDSDGRQFVHILREMEHSASSGENGSVLQWWWGNAKTTVLDYLIKSEGKPFRDKVEWFACYYNSCLPPTVSGNDQTDWRVPIEF